MKKWIIASHFIIALTIILNPIQVYATETGNENSQIIANAGLFEIYTLAESSDPIYLGSEATYLAEKQSRRQSWASILPQINLSAYRSNLKQDIQTTTSRTQDYTSNGYSLRIRQTLYRKSDFLRITQSNATVLKAQADFNKAKHDLILRVASDYFNVLAAKDNLKFNTAEYKALSRQLLQSDQKFQIGLIAVTDVHEARARHDQSKAQLIVAKNEVQTTLEILRELTGQTYNSIKSLTKDIVLISPQPEDINAWTQLALKNNLEIQAAKQFMLIAKNEIAIQKAGHLPTLDLVAEQSRNNTGGGFFGSRKIDQTSISLQFNLPLYEGGITSSKTTQARYKYSAARQQYIQSKRVAERLVRSSYLNVLANISQVKALKQVVISGNKALETTQAGYEVGTRTTVDVLNSQRELFRAKKEYARARYNYLLETLKLKKAAGILNISDLKKINDWIS